jgi:threonyl-tRNA synthetase
MVKIIKANYPIVREEVSFDVAKERILTSGESFKLDILQNIDVSKVISLYHIGNESWDLCAGPHVESTGMIPSDALELTTVSGAYWKGDDKQPMLQVCFLVLILLIVFVTLYYYHHLENLWNGLVFQGAATAIQYSAVGSKTP